MRKLEDRLRSHGFKSYVTSSETVNQNTIRLLPNLGLVPIGELQMRHGGELFCLKTLV